MIKQEQLPVFVCPTSSQKKTKVIDQKIFQTYSFLFTVNDFSWDLFFTNSKKNKTSPTHSKCLQEYLPKFPSTVSLKRRPKLQNGTVTTLKILFPGLRFRHGKHLIRTALEPAMGCLVVIKFINRPVSGFGFWKGRGSHFCCQF